MLDGGDDGEFSNIDFDGKVKIFLRKVECFFGTISSDRVLHVRSRSMLAYLALCHLICSLS